MDEQVVGFAVEDGIGLITVDNPPVNALSADVRAGISAALERADADPAVVAMVLIGAGRTFIAGADIRAFGKPRPQPPKRSTDVLEDSEKPVVAAIYGYALGGGLEHALACHYRIATRDAKLGLPEVLIGILPGGGGTQRLPRLIGPKAALDLIVSGRHVGAAEALALGLVDKLAEGDLRDEAMRFARTIAEARPLPRVSRRSDKLAQPAEGPSPFEAMRKSIARRARNQLAPFHCIAAVEAATREAFEEGLKTERRLFDELENSEEAKALRYAFFAEREAAKIPGIAKDVAIREVKTAAVIGAGTMGSGIAISLADHGIRVKIMETSRQALESGMRKIRDTYAVSVKRGSLAQAEVDRRLPLIESVEHFEGIADCDVVIEAAFENMAVKKELFAKLDTVMKPGALLLTNSSALDVDEIAAAMARPQDVAGSHFFSPANVMKLLEVVNGARTSPETLASVMKLGRRIGKVTAVAGNCDGFVANRSRAPFVMEMNILLEEGTSPEQIDKVMVDFGYPMGPFAVGDLAGLDINYATRQRRAERDPQYRKQPIADRMVELGRLGQKTGAGWYRYEPGDRTPRPDPEAARIIRATAAELGAQQRSFTDEEILRRLLFASVNEACRILEEGKAYRASDVDVMWLYGFGFPRYRGGLMYWADTIGVREVYDQIAAWHLRYGRRWQPASLLRRLAEVGTPLREAKGE